MRPTAPFLRVLPFLIVSLPACQPSEGVIDDGDEIETEVVPGDVVAVGPYRLKSVNSGKCADVSGRSLADGGDVIQWTCGASSTNQQWRFNDVGDGFYEVTAVHSGKCLDVSGASTADGANIQQWACRGVPQQQWKLVSVGTGIYNLRPRHSSKCMDVKGGGTADGTDILQWTCRSGATNQQWRLELVSGGTCTPESNATFCTRLGKDCGTVSGTDNCGASRSVACGSCSSPQTCGGGGTPNVCGATACTPESNATFCTRLGKNCGTVSGTDNCGASRSVACGSCTSPQTCGGGGTPNVCGATACTPESNTTFCSRLAKNCGTVSGTDNCGASRSVACGSCTSPQTCGGGGTPNVCGGGTTTGFRHPGVLVNAAQLDLIRTRALAGTQPTKAGYDKARTSPQASLSYTAKPWAVVECGPSSNPNYGCSDERGDAGAAYTHALMWNITRNEAYAKKSIEIMNAWARTLTAHTNHNAPLQTGWAGTMFGAAAELMRHTYTGWASADVDRMKSLFRNAYVPILSQGSSANGNWELIMIDALTNISVFLDDKALFDKAVAMWRKRVPAYIYLTTDGAYPKPIYSRDTPSELISYWYGQTTFVDGLAQETCRDFGHTLWGIAAAINTAETARQQGVNLYNEESKRLRAGLEFHAEYILGKTAPSWLCGGTINVSNLPTWEIAYNHFNTRLGVSMPLTKRIIEEKARPTGLNYFIAWETLTHAGMGAVGLP